MTAAAVEVRGFGYRAAGRTRWTPGNLSFALEPGERVLLLGASGSGKSTVLKAMADVLDSSGGRTGQVSIDGQPVSESRHRIGLMMQDPDAFLVLDRVGEDVAFGPQNQGLPPANAAEQAHHALCLVGLDDAANRHVDQLSGGERQRVALAGVLAMQPDLLLLDEPTSQLDPDGGRLIREAVARAVEGRAATLLVVEHRVDEWVDIIDRVLILGDDGTLTDGSLDDVMATDASQGTWLHPPTVGGAAMERRPRPPPEPFLAAAHLTHSYSSTQLPALADVTCTIQSGCVTAVSGANGSGKTTMIRAIGGLLAPDQGSVTATESMLGEAGRDLRTLNVWKWRSRALAGRISSVFQNPEHSFVATNVRSEIDFGPRALDVEVSSGELLNQLGLTHLASANPFTLSGGEQRRLSVAAALATLPQVLLLDEPTFGQDPSTWRQLVQLVLQQRDRGTAVVVVSHDVPFVDAVADTSFHMHSGRFVSPGTTDGALA